jgi:hypothetical protein
MFDTGRLLQEYAQQESGIDGHFDTRSAFTPTNIDVFLETFVQAFGIHPGELDGKTTFFSSGDSVDHETCIISQGVSVFPEEKKESAVSSW